MSIPVLSPCLSGYIVVAQTILVALTTVGLFPDRLRMMLELVLENTFHCIVHFPGQLQV